MPGPAGASTAPQPPDSYASAPTVEVEWRAIPGGGFRMGSDDDFAYPDDGETPSRSATVEAFDLAATTVTNADWAAFVEATGHVSMAERSGWSFVFAGFLAAADRFEPVAAAPWWRRVPGASWATPEGPGSDIEERPDHPVVHVSAADAGAFAAWAGGRLPTEAEWERAARGGLERATFPWGDELTPGGRHLMNVWQGTFPDLDTAADGWSGTCPVREYDANGYGLWCVTGNVWEWTVTLEGGLVVTKGGSYLCQAESCRRYRPAARQRLEPASTAGNLGFRIARAPLVE